MDFDLAPLLTFGGAVVTAIVTVFGTVYVARSRTRVDLGSSITTGFRELTDQLQEERGELNAIIQRQRDELVIAEKLAMRQENTIRHLRRRIALLEGKRVPPSGQ